jgi:hypothetical protein
MRPRALAAPALLGLLLLVPPSLSGPGSADVFPMAWNVPVPPPPLPVVRTDIAAARMDHFIVIAGGNAPDDGDLGTRVDLFDAFANAYIHGILPPLPVAVHNPAVVAVGSQVLVLGGKLLAPQGVEVASPLTWVLDTRIPIGLRQWLPGPPLPEGVSSPMAVTDGFQHLWLFGGFEQSGQASGKAWTMPVLAGNPAGLWLPLADMPVPRARGGAVQFDNQRIVLVGGESAPLAPTSEVDVYDVAANAWSQAAPLPTPREDLSVVRGADGIYAMGGRTPALPSAAVEFYDQDVQQWVALSPMPQAQWGAAAVGFLDDMYLFGGHDAQGDPTRLAQRAHVIEDLP